MLKSVKINLRLKRNITQTVWFKRKNVQKNQIKECSKRWTETECLNSTTESTFKMLNSERKDVEHVWTETKRSKSEIAQTFKTREKNVQVENKNSTKRTSKC